MILGRKSRNLRLIQSAFFFLVFMLESQTIFCHIRKVLENHNSGKCDKIFFQNFIAPPQIFFADTAMTLSTPIFPFTFVILPVYPDRKALIRITGLSSAKINKCVVDIMTLNHGALNR